MASSSPSDSSPPREELQPFPLRGISVSHLDDLQEEISSGFVKLACRCVGKQDIAPKPLARLVEKIGAILCNGAAGTPVSKLDCVHHSISSSPGDNESVTVTLILSTRTPGGAAGAFSLAQNSARIRDVLKTQVHRQSAARKLGEEAELVPFAGFSAVELSQELDLTTYEVCEVFVKPRTATHKQSYVDSLQHEDGEEEAATAAAGTLVIHSWSDPFKSILDSLQAAHSHHPRELDGMYVWLDLFSVNQHVQRYAYSPSWLTSTFCDALGQIGSAVLVLPNWREPTVLQRAWVMWELLACVQQGIELSVVMPHEQRHTFDSALFLDLPFLIQQCFSRVDASKADSHDAHALAQISNCIRDSVGFEGASLVVKDRLLEWLSVVSEQTSRDPEKTKDLLATSTFCFSLAKILSAGQGKHLEAEQMLRKAVDIRTIELGQDHDRTTEAQIALANVFRVQGKSSEAEVTLRKVCESLAKSKGQAHDDTLLALATLSRVLVDRGSFEEAEELCQDNLAVLMERQQGVRDKRTIETLVTLSQLADLRADSDLAALRLRSALDGYSQLYGPEHAHTLNCQSDLAGFLAELENFDEAEQLFRHSAEKLTAQLGGAHEWTVKAVTGLGVLLKVRESLGPNYTPGKFSTAAKMNQLSVFEEENSGLGVAVSSIRHTRHTRHEKLKQQQQQPSEVAKKSASRKHLRGWLEKLPMELCQREKERQMRHPDYQQPAALAALAQVEDETVPEPTAQKPKSMLFKMMSGLGGGSTKFLNSASSSVAAVVTRSKSITAAQHHQQVVTPEQQRQLLWERRFFQIQSNQKHSSVVYWLSDDDCRNGRDIRDNFDLDDYTSRIFETSPFGDLCFSITGPKGRFHLRAPTEESKREWIQVIKAALAFRGAADKAALFTNGPSSSTTTTTTTDGFSASFVNMDSLLQSQHSAVLLGTVPEAAPAAPQQGVSALLRADMDGISFE